MRIVDLKVFTLVLCVTVVISLVTNPPLSYILAFIWGIFAQTKGWMFE